MKIRKGVDKPIVLDELAKKCCKEKKKGKTYLEFIKEWVEGTKEPAEEEFRDLHSNLYDIVTQCLKNKYKEEYCTYGKAQKIVNMTFKYLYAYYCANSGENWNEKCFKYCHMPLDSYTLEWFRREISGVKKSKIVSWSNMGLEENEKSLGYKNYCKRINAHFEDKDVTPLQAEFVIWPYIQKAIAIESFIFAFNPSLSNRERAKIRKENLKSKIEIVKELLK